MFTLKLQRPQNSCMQRNQDCWPSSVTECTCCYTRSYICVHIYVCTMCFLHKRACTRRKFGSRTHASDRTKYEYPSFSICFRLFEKRLFGECSPCGLCGPAFPGMQQSCARGKKNNCATARLALCPFHILLRNSREMREIMNLVPKVCIQSNSIISIISSYIFQI